MSLDARAIVLIQKHLKQVDGKSAAMPGVLDTATVERITKILSKRKKELSPKHVDKVLGGDGSSKAVALVQLMAKDAGFSPGIVDGLWGPLTQNAFDSLIHRDQTGQNPEPWREQEIVPATANQWPLERESELIQFYGQVGTNQTSLTLPYTMVLAWDKDAKVKKISCHKKVSASVERVLVKTLNHYGTDAIHQLRLDLFGGCLNVRKKRGGTTWSMHAWGIALDFDPDNNQLKWGRDKATLARSEYNAWWGFWEAEGWCSLGRQRNFDWMHVQAARLP